MHRGYPNVSQERELVYVSGYGSGDPAFSAGATSYSGNITVFRPALWGTSLTALKTKTVFRLEEENSKEVWEVCRELYEELAGIVGEAEKQFWGSGT